MDNRQHFSIWYFVFVMLLMMVLQSLLFSRHVETLACSDFKTLLHAGKIKEVLIREDTISGTVDLRGADAVLASEVWKAISSQSAAAA